MSTDIVTINCIMVISFLSSNVESLSCSVGGPGVSPVSTKCITGMDTCMTAASTYNGTTTNFTSCSTAIQCTPFAGFGISISCCLTDNCNGAATTTVTNITKTNNSLNINGSKIIIALVLALTLMLRI